MLKERARIIAAGVLALDLVLVVLAFVLAYWLRDTVAPRVGWTESGLHGFGSYAILLPVMLPLWAALFVHFGFYQTHRTESLRDEIWSIAKVCGVAGIAFVLSVYLLRFDERYLFDGDRMSRAWIGLFLVTTFLLLVTEKLGLRLLARYVRSRGYNYRTMLVVGASEAGRAVVEAIDRHRFWGYRVLGFLRVEPGGAGAQFAGYPVLGQVEDLLQLVERTPVDEVIFATDMDRVARLKMTLAALEEQGIGVRFAWHRGAGRSLELGELGGIPILTYASPPAGPLALMGKRLMDISVSLLLLAVGLPLIVLIALAIRATSSGGVLFRQTRVGLNGRRFTMLKFRTMVKDAESRLGGVEHLNEMAAPVFKIRRDPRVTGVGRLLRRFSLDELPQLWNILRGDMSLVGPRPALPAEVEQYQRWQRRRLSMRPGLTCLWQVSGRNQVNFEEWVRLDLDYVDNWSPRLDLEILLKTIPVVLSGRGAW